MGYFLFQDSLSKTYKLCQCLLLENKLTIIILWPVVLVGLCLGLLIDLMATRVFASFFLVSDP